MTGAIVAKQLNQNVQWRAFNIKNVEGWVAVATFSHVFRGQSLNVRNSRMFPIRLTSLEFLHVTLGGQV